MSYYESIIMIISYHIISYYEFLGMRFMYEVHQVGVLEMGFKYGFFVWILGMSFRHAFIGIGIGIGFRNEFYI